jgi:hypothetical protein
MSWKVKDKISRSKGLIKNLYWVIKMGKQGKLIFQIRNMKKRKIWTLNKISLTSSTFLRRKWSNSKGNALLTNKKSTSNFPKISI